MEVSNVFSLFLKNSTERIGELTLEDIMTTTSTSDIIYTNITEISEITTTTLAPVLESEVRTLCRYLLVGWATFLVGLVGLFGNGLSAIILLRKSMRKRPMNILLFFLTLWDVLFIATGMVYFCIPIILKYLSIGRYFVVVLFPLLTPYSYALRCTAQLGSAFFTLLVTAERYIAVCHPLHSRWICSKKSTLIAAGLTSLFVVMYNFPRWFDYKTEVIFVNGELQYEVQSTAFRMNPIYYHGYLVWGAFVMTSAIPFIFLAIMNWFICRAISKFNATRSKLIGGNGSSGGGQETKEISLTKMLVCVVSVSLAASGLNLFLAIIDTFWVLELSWQLWYVEKVLTTFNSSINCVFYCAFGQQFRREFIQMAESVFCCLRREHRSGESKNISSSTNISSTSVTSI